MLTNAPKTLEMNFKIEILFWDLCIITFIKGTTLLKNCCMDTFLLPITLGKEIEKILPLFGGGNIEGEQRSTLS